MSPSAPLLLALPCLLEDAPAADGRPSAWLDLACLVLVLASAVLGARRGTWWQFVRLLGLVATLSVARALAPRLSQGLVDVFGSLSPAAANGLLWSAILLAGLVIVALVGRIGRMMLEGEQLSFGERAGGALLGLASGLLLATGLIVCTAQLCSPAWVEKNLRGTRAQLLVDDVARVLPSALDPIAAQRASSEVHAAEPQNR
jgi:uncharacterized membrane protein required for colicin V production